MPNSLDEAIQVIQKEIEVLRSRQVIPEEAIKALKSIYQKVWCEAFYDPYNKKSQECAYIIMPDLEVLKKTFHF